MTVIMKNLVGQSLTSKNSQTAISIASIDSLEKGKSNWSCHQIAYTAAVKK